MPRGTPTVLLDGPVDLEKGLWTGTWKFSGHTRHPRDFRFTLSGVDPKAMLHPGGFTKQPLPAPEHCHPAAIASKIMVQGRGFPKASYWEGSFVVGDHEPAETMEEAFVLHVNKAEDGSPGDLLLVDGYGENAAGKFSFHGTLCPNTSVLDVRKRYLPRRPRKKSVSSPTPATPRPLTPREDQSKEERRKSGRKRVVHKVLDDLDAPASGKNKKKSSSAAKRMRVEGSSGSFGNSQTSAFSKAPSASSSHGASGTPPAPYFPSDKPTPSPKLKKKSGSKLSQNKVKPPTSSSEESGPAWLPSTWLGAAEKADWKTVTTWKPGGTSNGITKPKAVEPTPSMLRHLSDMHRRGMSVYEGELKNDAPHGHGAAVYADGTMVEGQWKYGQLQGFCVMSDCNDRTFYEGEVVDGIPHGYGVWFLGSGVGGAARYEGEWNNGVFEGRGKILSLSGYRYMGEWLEGLPHGKGVMYTPDGGFYVGEWTRGKPDGKGDLSLTTGLRYHGSWKDGVMNGRGDCDYPKGSTYEGSFLNGLREGRGILKYSNGSMYTGRFKSDAIDGAGTMLVPKPVDGRNGEWVIPIECQDVSRIHLVAGFTEEGV